MKLRILTSLWAVLLVIASIHPAKAQDKQPVTTSMSLKEAQEYAVKNNANSRNLSLIHI